MKTNLKSIKKFGALPLLYTGAISLVVAAIGVAIGAQVLNTVQTSFTASSTAFNVTANFLTGLSQLASFAGVMGIVIAAVVIISLVTLLGGGNNRM